MVPKYRVLGIRLKKIFESGAGRCVRSGGGGGGGDDCSDGGGECFVWAEE